MPRSSRHDAYDEPLCEVTACHPKRVAAGRANECGRGQPVVAMDRWIPVVFGIGELPQVLAVHECEADMAGAIDALRSHDDRSSIALSHKPRRLLPAPAKFVSDRMSDTDPRVAMPANRDQQDRSIASHQLLSVPRQHLPPRPQRGRRSANHQARQQQQPALSRWQG
jgi:hypothetical protein